MKRALLLVLIGVLLGSIIRFWPARHRQAFTSRRAGAENFSQSTNGPGPSQAGQSKLAGANAGRRLPEKAAPAQSFTRDALRKRAWDAGFLTRLGATTKGAPITFDLLGGARASGTIQHSESLGGQLVYVSGSLAEPESGRLFFQKQTRTGVAGDFVGVVELPASQTAYRIEPSGAGGWNGRLERFFVFNCPALRSGKRACTRKSHRGLVAKPRMF